jgi:hypothetical protein
VQGRVALAAFDHRDVIWGAADKRKEYGASKLDSLEQLESVRERGGGLEYVPQKVQGRHAPLTR